MPKISKIEQQKKKKGRYSVYIDGRFFVGLTEREIVFLNLKKDMELSNKELNKLKETSSYSKVKEKSVKLLSIRSRSIKELEGKLQDKGYDQLLIKKAIAELKKKGYLNDKNFTKQWVKNRKIFKPSGKRKLFFELKEKKVESKIIENELSKITLRQEIKDATELAKRKMRLFDNIEKLKRKEKIIGFLQRRGFNWDAISKVLENIKL